MVLESPSKAYLSISNFSFFSVLLSLFNFSLHVAKEDEERLLQGINNYRMSMKLPVLKENDNAECLADEVAEKLQDQPCTNRNGAHALPGTGPQFSNYPDALRRCKVDTNTTRDGAILPACVPKLVSGQVLSNFTESQYARYLNDSMYTGIGIGSEDDWIVVVMSANTPTGMLANAAVSLFSLGYNYLGLSVILFTLSLMV